MDTYFYSENLELRDHLRDLGIGERITEMSLKERGEGGTRLIAQDRVQ
jgi:hypothetical protein